MALQISPGSTAAPPFDALMDASEALASFQRFSRYDDKGDKKLWGEIDGCFRSRLFQQTGRRRGP